MSSKYVLHVYRARTHIHNMYLRVLVHLYRINIHIIDLKLADIQKY